MPKIRIKNFGPIKEGCVENGGWIEVKKVTVFIGNQGSGKSTVAKVLSTLLWLEKAINRGDFNHKWSFEAFENLFLYQSLKDYLRDDTFIEFIGDLYSISYDKVNHQFPVVAKVENGNYVVPKIMYVPSERNFLSVVKNATGVRGLPEPLFEFAEELQKAQKEYDKKVWLPINQVEYQYDKIKNESYLIGKDFRLNLLHASSGFQSLVPLFLVSLNLSWVIDNKFGFDAGNISPQQSVRMNDEIAHIILNSQLEDSEKIKETNKVKEKFQNRAFINIVEEPELNLFPSSQKGILESLLAFSNRNKNNKLIFTTHSPYLINFLSLAIQGKEVKDRILDAQDKVSTDDSKILSNLTALKIRLGNIVHIDSFVDASNVAIYQFDDHRGSVSILPNPEGIPSDNNYLNQFIAHGNKLFDQLLEIEEEL